MSEKLKKGWKKWRFDQMAFMVNDRVDNPADADVERYVGLEHLDADSLKIRRWGSPDDVEATKLRFQPGDIIFGRRRAYQRKLGVADFEGICSAHAMVLRARPAVAVPEFLPFFMQSDLFMERAKLISVGSLSPTINWKTLAAEEFILPPLDEQRRIAEVLGAVQDMKVRLRELHDVSFVNLESLTQHTLFNFACTRTISNYCELNPEYLSQEQLGSSEIWEYADLSSVSFPMMIGELQKIRLCDAPSRAQRIARNGDLLVSTVRPNLRGHVSLCGKEKPIVASTGFAVLRPQMAAHLGFLISCVLSSHFILHCESRITGTAYPAIRGKDVSEFAIPDIAVLKERGLLTIFDFLLLQVLTTLKRQNEFITVTATAILKEILSS